MDECSRFHSEMCASSNRHPSCGSTHGETDAHRLMFGEVAHVTESLVREQDVGVGAKWSLEKLT